MGHSQASDCLAAGSIKSITERMMQSLVGRISVFNPCRVIHSAFQCWRKLVQYDPPSDKGNVTELGAFYENFAILYTQLYVSGDCINIKAYTEY